ncbi:MAG: glycosyltransferase family 4 protein [Dehalococcoidia bacterium]
MSTIVAVRNCDCGLLGPEMLVLQQARALVTAGHRFVIVNLWDGNPPEVALHDEARRRGLESLIVRSRGDLDPTLVTGLRRTLAGLRPDIVHTHGAKGEVATLAATRGMGLPLVGSFYGIQTRRPLHSFAVESTSLFSLRLFSRVIANAAELRRQLIRVGVPERRIEVHLSTIDTTGRGIAGERERREARAALDLPPAAPVITTIARLDFQKGHSYTLEAMAALAPELPDLTYLIVGDGITRPLLERRARQLDLTERVRFLGYRADLDRICAAADVVVAASLNEGSSVTLLEALSYGAPVLATAVGGTPEVITDGVNGLLIGPRDAPAIAAALRRLFADPALRARLGAAGRRTVNERFSAEAGGRRLERTYRALLAARAGARAAS